MLLELIDRACLLELSFRRHVDIDVRAGATIQLEVADFISSPVVPVFMMMSGNTSVGTCDEYLLRVSPEFR